MTDDVVVVHGSGRVSAGREAVLADLVSAFNDLRVTQVLRREETVLADDWAFDRVRVHTTVTVRRDGTTSEFDSHTITILSRDAERTWRVARTIGVVERLASAEA